jgi:flagellar biogenesis protein FliO
LAEADQPARKRAVPASRRKAAASPARKPAARRKPAPILEDEPATPNYALRLTEGLDEEPCVAVSAAPEDTFALRLSEALHAINAANGLKTSTPDVSEASEPAQTHAPSWRTWLAALDKLPPIRLPIGPPIPWRLGLPGLLALVIVMGLMSRSAGQADSAGVQLPAQQIYPVQQEAPLFTKPAVAPDTSDVTNDAAAPVAQTTAPQVQAQAQAQPIGVSESAPLGGFDLVDVGIKLIAVLGLAYGSLMLLKRLGYGGAGALSRSSGDGQQVRVVSSIALAPNRSVHVISVPGGKTLLVGATPTSVNLLSELDAEN